MADHTVTESMNTCDQPIEERIYSHGEYLIGTKHQLQAIGIGAGIAFPGEPGAKPRQITTRDARGWKARIKLEKSYSTGYSLWTGRYEVHIEVPVELRAQRELEELKQLPRVEQIDRARVNAIGRGVALVTAFIASSRIKEFEESGSSVQSVKAHRERAAGKLDAAAEKIELIFGQHHESPYVYDESAMQQVNYHVNAIIQLALTARVIMDFKSQRQALLSEYAVLDIEPPPQLKQPPPAKLSLVK